MNEKHAFLEFFSHYQNELGYSFVAAMVAAARHWQQQDPFRTIATNGVIVAAIAFGMNTILTAFGINGEQWGYLASVFLGYVGHKVFFLSIVDRVSGGNAGAGVQPGSQSNDIQTRRKE